MKISSNFKIRLVVYRLLYYRRPLEFKPFGQSKFFENKMPKFQKHMVFDNFGQPGQPEENFLGTEHECKTENIWKRLG